MVGNVFLGGVVGIPTLTPPPRCIVTTVAWELGWRGKPSLSVLQIYLEGWILSFSCVFAVWTRWCCWCIAVFFLHPSHSTVPC